MKNNHPNSRASTHSNSEGTFQPSQNQALCAGLILAGGKNTRMNGQNKALLMLNGRTLMECVASNLYTQTHLNLIAAGPHDYNLKNTPIFNSTKQLADTGEYGPLEGIVSGLQHLSQHTQHAWLASSPCDTPRMPDKWVNALLQSMHSQVNSVRPNQSIQGAYAVCRGRSHYAHAIWPVAALPYLQERMHNQQLSLRGAHSTMGSKAIELSHISDTNDFSNINKSSDLIHL